MISFSFCFGQVFVSEILNAEVVCFLSTNWVIPIVICFFINAGEMKTFEKSHMYSRVHIRSKLKEMMLLLSSGKNYFLFECINALLTKNCLNRSSTL